MTSIHPMAVVDPQAELGCDVEIGPFCVVEAGAVIGDGCCLHSHAVVKRDTTLGRNNVIGEASVLGGRPQHLRAGVEVGELIIGEGNAIREHVTIHRGLEPGMATRVGDHNLIMINAHIAHDCEIGSHTIIANAVLLAGHITIGDRAYLSGAVAMHQFCRVGPYAMVGGQAHIKQDVPPYVTVDGYSSRVVGLNVIGLKRNGFSSEKIHQIKEAYRVIYRSGLKWTEVLEKLAATFVDGPAAAYHPFLSSGRRGFVQERVTPRSATLSIVGSDETTDAATDDAALRRAG